MTLQPLEGAKIRGVAMTPRPPPCIDAFVEGATEVAVINTLADRELLKRPAFRTGERAGGRQRKRC